MARRGGSIGMIILIVTAAIVLFLVARNWQAVAPIATSLDAAGNGAPINDHGQTGAGAALRQGNLPGLQDMRDETNAHADELQEAMQQID